MISFMISLVPPSGLHARVDEGLGDRAPTPSAAVPFRCRGAGDDDDEVGEDPVGDERLGTVGHELLGEHGVAAEVRDPAATELLTGRRVAAG
jgi:hypothetical protein